MFTHTPRRIQTRVMYLQISRCVSGNLFLHLALPFLLVIATQVRRAAGKTPRRIGLMDFQPNDRPKICSRWWENHPHALEYMRGSLSGCNYKTILLFYCLENKDKQTTYVFIWIGKNCSDSSLKSKHTLKGREWGNKRARGNKEGGRRTHTVPFCQTNNNDNTAAPVCF